VKFVVIGVALPGKADVSRDRREMIVEIVRKTASEEPEALETLLADPFLSFRIAALGKEEEKFVIRAVDANFEFAFPATVSEFETVLLPVSEGLEEVRLVRFVVCRGKEILQGFLP
jgi:hypothetical protein